jgi:hypothetical protein
MGDDNCKQALSMAQMWSLNNLDGLGLHYLPMPHQ